MHNKSEGHYVLGHAHAELQRLIRQSAFYAELTENVFRSAGLGEGMRVLDAGCGAGDVSFLAARLVGPSGAVVGVDQSPQALAFARERAEAEDVWYVKFIEADLAQVVLKESFDALIGRFVLMYLEDPSTVLRMLAQYVQNGGIIAFQEMDISTARSVPDLPLYKKCGEWIKATFERAKVDVQMGLKLSRTFRRAGLPEPQMKLSARIDGGPEWPGCEYVADIVASLLPMMERFGVATAAEVQIETLAGRLKEESKNGDGILISPSLVGAWTRKPV